MGRRDLQNPDVNRGIGPGRAAALRRPRARGAALRNDAMEEFAASLRKAGPKLRPDRGRPRVPALPFEWFVESTGRQLAGTRQRVQAENRFFVRSLVWAQADWQSAIWRTGCPRYTSRPSKDRKARRVLELGIFPVTG